MGNFECEQNNELCRLCQLDGNEPDNSIKGNELDDEPNDTYRAYASKSEVSRTEPGMAMEMVVKGVRVKFRYIPEGKFLMGSPEDEDGRFSDEEQREVAIDKPFWLAETACTQELWYAVMGNNPAHFQHDLQAPVEQVSWNDVQAFIKKLSEILCDAPFRLPVEAEWEYACRAGGEGKYCFGDSEEELGKYAWYGKNSDGMTHPVGQKKPNNFGLYDMNGNVWEWCLDIYRRGVSLRVMRGGSWYDGPEGVRCAFRLHDLPHRRGNGIGFRLAMDASGNGEYKSRPTERLLHGTMERLKAKYQEDQQVKKNPTIKLATELGQMVARKQLAYGDSFGQSDRVLEVLYPDGIKIEQYKDMLAVVRIVDKLFRIANKKDSFGEDPFRDIAGYGLLGAAK